MKIIGITQGCPVGIGPEIILRYFQNRPDTDQVQPIIIGDSNVLRRCGRALSLPANCVSWHPGDHLGAAGDSIPVLEISRLTPQECQWGNPNIATGKAMARYIEKAVELCSHGIIDGIATCPISKTALQQAGYNYPGHTEMLATLTNCQEYAMMMSGNRLKVVLVTIHCPLRSVSSMLSTAVIDKLITLTDYALRLDFGVSSPRIGVAGFNPHGSENGIFGDEEQLFIEPAVKACRQKNITVTGPHPPDTIFFQAAEGRFDAVICMYHDQGLIPFKLLHFADGVNVTLGLPIVRTSVDHGTGYDIAGKGIANHQSLQAAVTLAASIAIHRAKYRQHKD